MERGSCRTARRPSRRPVEGGSPVARRAERAGRSRMRRAAMRANAGADARLATQRALAAFAASSSPTGGRPPLDKKPTEPGDGAFDPSVREASARVAGVTRTVPGGLSQAGPRPPRAPGVADKTGACPELVEARPRGASVGVETVIHIKLRASARRSAQPSNRPPKGAAANRVPSPLAGEGGPSGPDEGSRHGLTSDRHQASRNPSSVGLRPPPSPARGEGTPAPTVQQGKQPHDPSPTAARACVPAGPR
jgi:hypothetical protein